MPLPIEELIKAGPEGTTATVSQQTQRVGEMFSSSQEEDEKPFSLDNFQKVKDGISIEEENKKVLEKEEKKAIENEKKEDDSTKTEEEQELSKDDKKDSKEDAPLKEEKKTEDKTDDSGVDSLIHLELGISPGSVTHFKNMNKAAREWISSELKTRFQKITELQGQLKEAQDKRVSAADGNNLPSAWYEHPQAVNLLPDYQQVVSAYSRAEAIIKHYREQLLEIEEGNNWTDLEMDDKGQVQYKQYKPNNYAKRVVSEKIDEYNRALQKLESRAGEIKQNFQANHLKNREAVVALENQYFPQYSDSKVLETNNNWKAIQNAIQKFGLGNDRMAGVTSKMYVYTMATIEENEKLQAKIKELEAAVAKGGGNKNGPTGDEINKGTSATNGKKKYEDPDDEPVAMNIFDKLKSGGGY